MHYLEAKELYRRDRVCKDTNPTEVISYVIENSDTIFYYSDPTIEIRELLITARNNRVDISDYGGML